MYPLNPVVLLGPRIHSEEFELQCWQLLEELVYFQKRAYKKNPLKQKKRVIFGFKEGIKLLRNSLNVKVILVAADASIGVLQENDWNDIKSLCGSKQIPILVALSKDQLGNLVGRKSLVSAVFIVSVEGSYERFSLLKSMNGKLKDEFIEKGFWKHYLWHLCAYGQESLFSRLKEMPNIVIDGMTPLFAAIKGLGTVHLIRKLIEEYKQDFSLVDFGLNSALHLACARGDIRIVEYLKSIIPKPLWFKRNCQGNDVILITIKENHRQSPDILKLLIEEQSNWPLMEEYFKVASQVNNPRYLEELIRIASKDRWLSSRYLHLAIKSNCLDNVILLVKNKMTLSECLDGNGMKALDWLAEVRNEPMLNYLKKTFKF